MALERFWSKLVALEKKLLDYYDGYRYWKRKGARLGPTIGRKTRARIRRSRRYQAMICKAHAKHAAKVECVHHATLLFRWSSVGPIKVCSNANFSCVGINGLRLWIPLLYRQGLLSTLVYPKSRSFWTQRCLASTARPKSCLLYTSPSPRD